MQKRNTAQKKAIFAELSSRKDHPSATRLYEDLKEKYPGLSKATVYRVLKNAADEGEILRLHVGTEDRFDGDVRPHCHIVCTRCEDVFDAPFPLGALAPLEDASGYMLERGRAEFFGVCPACQQGKNA
ncbi:MAG: transcriptional repressor [Clostridia bacterium]|nr:transcriptional repressor [Clostridia bacterium]